MLFFCAFFIYSPFIFSGYAKADTLNDKVNFLVDSSYDSNNRSNIDTTLRKISNYAFFYVENEYYDSLGYAEQVKFDSDLENLASSFDNTIYPRMRNIFGDEWSPGIDNMEHITILFTKTKENVGGYFNPNDEYPKSNVVDDKSNEREMLYLNAIFAGNDRIESFIAHEFQHMITWYHKTKLRNINDDIWLNESRSEYASTAIGYDDDYQKSNLRARVENFMQNQTDSLTEWQNKIQDYSSVNLFSQYLADHFGGDTFRTMIGNDTAGIESINKALSENGFTSSVFSDIFSNWSVANYLNNRYYLDGKYGYINPNLTYDNFHLAPTKTYFIGNDDIPVSISASIKDWSSRYFEIKPANNLTGLNIEISFNGDNSGKFAVPYALMSGDAVVSVSKAILDRNQDNKILVKNFGTDITSVILMPNSQKKTEGFGSEIESYSFSISVKTIIGELYPDGTILKSYKNPEVYLIEDGKKRWITSAAAFISNGYSWNNITYINSNELDFFERGENIYAKDLKPDGTLIKGSGPEVYIVENGMKRWITTAGVFVSRGYKWENIITVSENELGSYTEGQDISFQNLKPDGTLIKGSGPEVYIVENGMKRWITTAGVFVSRGYKWEEIVVIPDIDLNSYADGLDIDR
jgi:hypothetical protein